MKRKRASASTEIVEVSRVLSCQLDVLDVTSHVQSVKYVYNAYQHAWEAYVQYVEAFARERVPMLLVGMNPGPWGMAQTGVPFGDVVAVTEFLKISRTDVKRPKRECPSRRVLGFDCPRREVSGTRLWGFMERRFGSSEQMRQALFVYNYCPLSFMSASGANVTLDKLPLNLRGEVQRLCDKALLDLITVLQPQVVVGIGIYVGNRIKSLDVPSELVRAVIQHPSPASPSGRKWESASGFNELQLGPPADHVDLDATLPTPEKPAQDCNRSKFADMRNRP
jgi:single-strand selective monofunctional uracil DNA glycosylase